MIESNVLEALKLSPIIKICYKSQALFTIRKKNAGKQKFYQSIVQHGRWFLFEIEISGMFNFRKYNGSGQFVSYRIASNCNLQPQEIWAFSQFVNVQHYFAFGRDLLENLVSKLSTGHYCCHYFCLDFFISTNPIAVFKSRSFSSVFELSNSLE